MRREPRLFADEDDVGVREPPAFHSHLLPGPREEPQRVGARERGVAGGEERADVLESGGPEQRVGERVREDVAVGVAGQPARMLDLHPAEHEGHAVLERVRVEARADAVLRHERGPPAARPASRS